MRHRAPAFFIACLLVACASARSNSAISEKASFAGMDTLHYTPQKGPWEALPAHLQAVLINLPQAVAPLDRSALAALSSLRYAHSTKREFYARGDDFSIWIRHFDGRQRGHAGIALQIAGSCNRLPQAHLMTKADYSALSRSCSQRGLGEFDTGLLLFTRTPDGELHHVTEVEGRLFPDLSDAQQRMLDDMGVSPPFAASGMLANQDRMAIWREADPDRPLPADLPGTSDAEPGLIHGGDLLWTGNGFRIQRR